MQRSKKPGFSILPSCRVSDTIEALELGQTSERLRIVWLFLIFLGFAVVLLANTSIERIVSAEGVLRSRSDRVELKVNAIAQVADVFTREGAAVQRGDPILALDCGALREHERELRTRIAEQSVLLDDLELVLRMAPSWSHGEIQNTGDALQVQDEHWSRAIQGLRTEEVRSQAAGFYAELKSSTALCDRSKRACERVEALALQGLVSQHELEGARAQLHENELDRIQRRSAAAARWLQQQRHVREDVSNVRIELATIERELRKHVLQASIGGRIVGLSAIVPGQLLQRGQVVGYISPATDLVAEVYVAPRDVADVAAGQAVVLQVDDPDSNGSWLNGRVAAVSPDILVEGPGRGAFRVVIESDPLHRVEWQLRGSKQEVGVVARFSVERLSLFKALLRRVKLGVAELRVLVAPVRIDRTSRP